MNKALFALLCSVVSISARAQNCNPQWLAGVGVPGANSPVNAMTVWDPDGAGPQPSVVVVGGTFDEVGGVLANFIVSWNPTTGTWAPIGIGMNGTVRSLAVVPNGAGGSNLVAGGAFTVAGGAVANHIARWNGSVWSPLGTGISDVVEALAALPNGAGGFDVVAGGDYPSAGGGTASNIARWNGSAWLPFGTGIDNGVNALAVVRNSAGGSDLVAGGGFTSAGGVTMNNIARWNGGAWSAMGTGMNNLVIAVTVLPNAAGGSDLVAGGFFTTAGGVAVNRIARWNGSTWSALGTGMNDRVMALVVLPNGAGGSELVAGGFFTTAGGVAANYIARWNGSAWSALGNGMDGGVLALAAVSNVTGESDLIAGGGFTTAGGVTAFDIARWGVPSGCSMCDSIDYNGDGVFPDSADIENFLSCFAGGLCPNSDIDFNNDGVFPDSVDIEALLRVFGGGAC